MAVLGDLLMVPSPAGPRHDLGERWPWIDCGPEESDQEAADLRGSHQVGFDRLDEPARLTAQEVAVHIDQRSNSGSGSRQSRVELAVGGAHRTRLDSNKAALVVPELRVVDRGHQDRLDVERVQKRLDPRAPNSQGPYAAQAGGMASDMAFRPALTNCVVRGKSQTTLLNR